MGNNYLPMVMSEMLAFASNFIEKVQADPAAYGLTIDEVALIAATTNDLKNTDGNYKNLRTAAQAASEQRKKLKRDLEIALRAASGRMQSHPDVNDAMRTSVKLPIRSRSRTAPPAPDSRPQALIDMNTPLRHIVSIFDSGGLSRGKPKGVRGCEIWCKIGGEATFDESEYRYFGTATAGSLTVNFAVDDVGKQANYLLRWVNTAGVTGAWSKASATITK